MTDTDTVALTAAWRHFSAWLAAHSPDDHAALRPPADAGRITHLEEGLGFTLHPQLRALLELHDGVAQPPDGETYPAGSFLPLGHRLIPTEHILTRHREFAEVLPAENFGPESWRVLVSHAHWWVPIALPNDGGLLFVDHLPGPVYGHVYEMGLGSGGAAGSLWATGLTDMFTALTDSLTTGRPFHHFVPDTHRHAPGHHRIGWQVVL